MHINKKIQWTIVVALWLGTGYLILRTLIENA